MFDTARAAAYEPASNVKGDVDAATWVLLLDRLDGLDVVVVGTHAPVTTTAIEALFPASRHADGGRSGGGPADLVVVAPGHDVPDGAVGERTTVVRIGGAGRGDASLGPNGDGVTLTAPVHALDVPFAPERPRPALVRRSQRVLERAAVRLGAAPAASVARTQALRLGAGALERGTAMTFPADADRRSLPAYVLRIAAEGGRDLGGRPWALIADADYWSQKALFLVDDVAVKVSRVPAFSRRLDNEHAGLVYASASGWSRGRRSPEPLFAGHEAGLAVVGQERVSGVPFEEECDGTPRCPALGRALAVLRELSTVSRTAVDGDDARAAYRDIVAAFVGLTSPTDSVRAQLERDAEDAASAGVAVAVHGDPAPWNLLVRAGGLVCFLDWENFERSGPPLWDIALLVQSTAAMAVRRRGGRYTASTFAEHLLADTPWRALLEREAAASARELGFDEGLLWPLLRLWLSFQALKAVTRHPAGHRDLHAIALEAACAP